MILPTQDLSISKETTLSNAFPAKSAGTRPNTFRPNSSLQGGLQGSSNPFGTRKNAACDGDESLVTTSRMIPHLDAYEGEKVV
jgi:hypothetical protein